MRSRKSKKDILIIEDDPRNLKLVRDLLQVSGYSVLVATNGRDGLEIAKKERPHLILMDIQLPDLDGLEAAKILKSIKTTKIIPIIALTAYAMEKDEQRVRNAGCDAYISKPINVKHFLRTIKYHLISK